ncbi:MAG: preprotein translocase subunit SecA, partial [Erysipelotrichaceae bacterium]|nr:preprotein translocase subunit SecA [Erysipelotrichaceae bacterium]
LFEQMGDMPIENKTVTKAISSAQKRVEGLNFDIRKALLDYDDVMRQQRETMYAQRNYILEHEDIHSVVENMFRREMENIVEANTSNEGKNEVIDYETISNRLNKMGVNKISKSSIEGMNKEDTIAKCLEMAFGAYEDKIKPVKEQIKPVERTMVLRLMDRAWQNQIDIMSKLREGIHLRSYASNNPLEAYVEEGYELFENMMNTISSDVVTFCNNLKIVIKER